MSKKLDNYVLNTDLYDASVKLHTANTLLSILRDYIYDIPTKTTMDAVLFAGNQDRMSALVGTLIDYIYDTYEIVSRLNEQTSEV